MNSGVQIFFSFFSIFNQVMESIQLAFENLSEEIYCEILKYLDDFDLQQLKAVNRKFSRICTDSSLRRHLLRCHSNRLDKKLKCRPGYSVLAGQNILKTSPNVSASLAVVQIKLSKKLRATNLVPRVKNRMNVVDLERQKILIDPVHVAMIICPSVKDKIRSFNRLTPQCC
eukprot:Sdes_comp16298_c0_seq1m5655